mmetsp:Transcript_24325/g.60947  ORF Transcript_24325/g.60947 Transcript_24325/m.60947 type:complete len:840 (-) Transcript_24325:241-2760(-)
MSLKSNRERAAKKKSSQSSSHVQSDLDLEAELKFELSLDSDQCVRLQGIATSKQGDGRPRGFLSGGEDESSCSPVMMDDVVGSVRVAPASSSAGSSPFGVRKSGKKQLKSESGSLSGVEKKGSQPSLSKAATLDFSTIKDDERLSVSVDENQCVRLEAAETAEPGDGKARGLFVEEERAVLSPRHSSEQVIGFLKQSTDSSSGPDILAGLRDKLSQVDAAASEKLRKRTRKKKSTKHKSMSFEKKNFSQFASVETVLRILMSPDTDERLIEMFLGMHSTFMPGRTLLDFLHEQVEYEMPTVVRVLSILVATCPTLMAMVSVNAYMTAIAAKGIPLSPADTHRINSIKLTMIKHASRTNNQGKLPQISSEPHARGLDDLFPQDLAKILTAMDHQMYSAITLEDMLCAPKMAPSITEFVRRSNKVSFWIASRILSHQGLVARADCIKFWIDFLEECIRLQSMNLFMVVNGALNLVSISRLKETWNCLPKSTRATFQNIQSWSSTSHNYRQYRELLATTTSPCVPFMGIFCRDLIYVCEGEGKKYLVPRSKLRSCDEIIHGEILKDGSFSCDDETATGSYCDLSSSDFSITDEDRADETESISLESMGLQNKAVYGTNDAQRVMRKNSALAEVGTIPSRTDRPAKRMLSVGAEIRRSTLAMRIRTPWEDDGMMVDAPQFLQISDRETLQLMLRNVTLPKSWKINPIQDDKLVNITFLLQLWPVIKLFLKLRENSYDVPSLLSDVPMLTPEAAETIKNLPSMTEDELYEMSILYEPKKKPQQSSSDLGDLNPDSPRQDSDLSCPSSSSQDAISLMAVEGLFYNTADAGREHKTGKPQGFLSLG